MSEGDEINRRQLLKNVAVMTGFNTHVEEVNPLYVEWSYIRLPLAKSVGPMF